MKQRRLAALLMLLFLALAVPTAVLVYQAYGQLKWEAFYQHQRLARDLAGRIDAAFAELIRREQGRPVSDYEFLNVEGTDGPGFLQRSPLSAFPPAAEVPGLVGYFQVDGAGRLRTPLVPDTEAPGFGIGAGELELRRAQEARIRGILDRNRLVQKSDTGVTLEAVVPASDDAVASVEEARVPESAEVARSDESPARYSFDSVAPSAAERRAKGAGQSAFDQLIAGEPAAPAASSLPDEQVADLKLEDSYRVAEEEAPTQQEASKKQAAESRLRRETVNRAQVFEESTMVQAETDADTPRQLARIETFESEVEPMSFALLDSGHFVLFRRVWHQDERYVQGLLIERSRFLEALVEPAFRQSTLATTSRLIVAWRGGILASLEPAASERYEPGRRDGGDELLYQTRLVAPFGDVELIFTLASLPLGAGGKVVLWTALVLALVLVGGFALLYQLGLRQLALARQQQDFVSAVSHELKTPLTSIRMYGEMLREGWADEAKRKTYYDFIFHEAERLTRLINNVLQLARLSRNEQAVRPGEISVRDALAELRPRLESQLEPSGFELDLSGQADVESACIRVDPDSFIQIFTNLVDNAIKFSADSDIRRVDMRYRRLADGRLQFSVRDYGPGIAPDQMKKIFRLFYRAENELTRETVGTGIGLALVQQLARAMSAEVDVVNRDPGAEFRVSFREQTRGT